MRDWQGRNRAIGNADVPWPKAERSCDELSGGTEAPPFPPDGLYNSEKCNPFSATELVRELLDHVANDDVLYSYILPPDSGPAPFEGMGSVGDSALRPFLVDGTPHWEQWLIRHGLYENGGPIVVGPDNYCAVAQHLDDLFQELTLVDVAALIENDPSQAEFETAIYVTTELLGCVQGDMSCTEPSRGEVVGLLCPMHSSPPASASYDLINSFDSVSWGLSNYFTFPDIVFNEANDCPPDPLDLNRFANGCYTAAVCSQGGRASTATVTVSIPSVRGQGELYKNVKSWGDEPWFFMPGRRDNSGQYLHDGEYERLGTFQSPTTVQTPQGPVTVGQRSIGDTPFTVKEAWQEDFPGGPLALLPQAGERGWQANGRFLAVLRPEFEHTPDDVVLQRSNCDDCGIGTLTLGNSGPHIMVSLGKSARGTDGYLLIRGDTLIGSGAEMLLPVGQEEVEPGPGPAEMANPHSITLHAPWDKPNIATSGTPRRLLNYVKRNGVNGIYSIGSIFTFPDNQFVGLQSVIVPSGSVEISTPYYPLTRQRAFDIVIRNAGGTILKTITFTYTQPSIQTVAGTTDLIDITANLSVRDGAPGEPEGTGLTTTYTQTRRIRNFMLRGDDPFNFDIENSDPTTEDETVASNVRVPRRVPVGNLPMPDPADDHQWYAPMSDRGTWTISNGQWVKRMTPIDPPQGVGDRAVEVSLWDLQNNLVYSEDRVFQLFGAAERLIRSTVTPAGQSPLVESWEYDDRGELTLAVEPFGRWTKYVRSGNEHTTVRQFKDNALVSDLQQLIAQNKAYVFTRESVDLSGVSLLVNPSEFTEVPVIERSTQLQGVEVGRTYEINWPHHADWLNVDNLGLDTIETSSIRLTSIVPVSNLGAFVVAQLNNPGASPHSIAHQSRYYVTPSQRGYAALWPMEMHNRPLTRFEADGTFTWHSYQLDSLGRPTTISRRGRVADSTTSPVQQLLAVRGGVRLHEVFDAAGRQALSASWDMQGTATDDSDDILLESREVTAWDSTTGRPAEIGFMDGTSEQITYTCCEMASRRDRNGILTEYAYDAYDRLLYTISAADTPAALRTSYVYDAANRVVATKRGEPGQEVTLSLSVYDFAGRLISSQDALGNVTYYTEATDAQTGRMVRSTTLPDPDGAGPLVSPTLVTWSYPDGSTYEIGGTGQHAVRYDYGAEVDTSIGSTSGVTWVKEIRLGEQGQTTEWVKTFRDPGGRSYKTVYPDGATDRTYFDASGRVVRHVDPDGVTTLYREGLGFESNLPGVATDWDGAWRIAAVDMDQDGAIDFAGNDQVSRTVSRVLQTSDYGGANFRRTTSAILTTANDADSWLVLGQQDVLINGRASWSVSFGQVAESTTTLSPETQETTSRTTNSDGTYSVSNTLYGRPIASRSYLADNTLHAESLTAYDANGRVASVTDTLGTTSPTDDRVVSYTYDVKDRVISTSITGAQSGDPLLVTSATYDALDRVVSSTSPDGTTAYTSYLPTGEVAMTWGGKSYPVEYTYDSQGRPKTLTTWQEFDFTQNKGASGGATTSWVYDATRGWLTSKSYQGQSGPAYQYWPSGRLKKRTWARGVYADYAYSAAGALASINNSDTTPDVEYAFDRRGQVVEITDGTGTRTLWFNELGQIIEENLNAGSFTSAKAANEYDEHMRRSRSLLEVNSSPVNQVDYGYESNSSRLASVTMADKNRVDYTYDPDNGRVTYLHYTIEGTENGFAKFGYDKLDRTTLVGSGLSPAQTESHEYTYNLSGERTRIDLNDGTYWKYEYDNLGQVSRGTRSIDLLPTGPTNDIYMPGQQFEYHFDHIGNRTATAFGGDEDGDDLSVATYTPNLLNQYTSRTVPDIADIMGYANADYDVYFLNPPGGPPAIQDFQWEEYYQKAFWWDNSADPVYEGVDILGFDAPVETRWIFLPETPEAFTYDADGNLLSDGRWNYAWDGDNRLIAMETNASASSVAPAVRLEFDYDYMSRRVAKRVYEQDGSTWNLVKTSKFIYDGWNLVAELDDQDNVVRTCAWGLDLSGSLQGAGGVGGLVFQYIKQTDQIYHAYYDANGNVTSLRDGSDEIAAAYAYGPFGEPLTARGDADVLASNPFKFSTKYTDAETGLLYYGYRFYNPDTGRWLSRDPIGEAGGSALFGFVSNNAVTAVDPLGLETYQAEEISSIDNQALKTWEVTTTVKSYIAPIGINIGRFWARGYIGAVRSLEAAMLTDLAMRENPTTPAKDKGYRLYSESKFRFTCDSCDRVTLISAQRDLDGGTEGPLPAVVKWFEDPVYGDWVRYDKKYGDVVYFQQKMKGRPHLAAALGLEIVVGTRTSVWIWHQLEGHLYCANGVGYVDTELGLMYGSNFPSRRLWVNSKLVETWAQGPFSALWDADPFDNSLVR